MASLHHKKQSMAAGLGLVLLWSYWPVLGEMAERWYKDPKYSHGYLVPVFAGWLLWQRLRRAGPQFAQESWVGSSWGLAVLFAGACLHLAGGYLYMDFLAEGSILVSLTGVCLCLAGPSLLRVAAPSIAFLVFMLPLPYRVESALGYPLQRLATLASTYLLQMLGFYASAQGNIIELNGTKLGVVEACSGLGMLVTFFAMAVAVAIVLKRPLLDRVLVVLSAVPVALIANVVRITATGILGETVGTRVAHDVYHTYAGYLMMPLALALLWMELKIIARLLVELPPASEHDIALNLAPATGPTARIKKSKARARS